MIVKQIPETSYTDNQDKKYRDGVITAFLENARA
jgi:hypothetical protein